MRLIIAAPSCGPPVASRGMVSDLRAGLPWACGIIVGIGQRGTAQQTVGTCALFLGLHQRRREIVGQALALVLRGRAEQPQQQEEGHHGGHEIGIGDFPGAAVMAALRPPITFLTMIGGGFVPARSASAAPSQRPSQGVEQFGQAGPDRVARPERALSTTSGCG